MKKLSPNELLSNLTNDILVISNKIKEHESTYINKMAELELNNSECYSKNKELSKDNNQLKAKLSNALNSLEIKDKRINKYEKILNLTPGTSSNKLKLILYFSEEFIPRITERIESKYTSKIKEYLEGIIREKDNEEEEELYKVVEGTVLEFLSPYIRLGYVEVDKRALMTWIKNPCTRSYENWYTRVFSKVLKVRDNLSCPRSLGELYNPVVFRGECIMDLLNHIYDIEFVEYAKEYMKKTMESMEGRRKYGISAMTEKLNLGDYPEIGRDILLEWFRERGEVMIKEGYKVEL